MDQSELREAMDACRAEHDDLNLPEMVGLAEGLAAEPAARREFDRVQRLDRRIAASVVDVSVPAGLAERILARLEQQTAAPAADSVATASGASNEPCGRLRYSRRTWVLAGLAASLLVAFSAFWFWQPHKPLSTDVLIGESGEWFTQVWDRNQWTPLAANERVLTSYPPSDALRAVPRRWSDVSGLVGERAVVYDLTVGGRRAALFVIPSSDLVTDPSPPFRPQSTTLGLMIGCWQSQGMVYVLVVDGTERDYQNLIRPVPQPPLA